MIGKEPPMTWLQSPLVWSRKENYSISWGLHMPIGIPIAAGVLALLALLALALHCLKEAWKSRWNLCWGGWRCPQTWKNLQLVFNHRPDEGQLGILSSEHRGPQMPSSVSPEGPNGTRTGPQLWV